MDAEADIFVSNKGMNACAQDPHLPAPAQLVAKKPLLSRP